MITPISYCHSRDNTVDSNKYYVFVYKIRSKFKIV